MTHIKVINPNTARAMTEAIGLCARAVAAPSTTITAVSPSMGPASIESHYDEALAVPGLLAEIAAGEHAGVDGYVIACFGDPGLPAARELASGPVVGIAEAAMHAATLVGRGFSVVTTLSRTVGRAWDLAHQYGFANACRGVHACDIPVLELDDPASDARRVVTELCAAAAEADGSDSIVLGCAGMAAFCAEVSREVGFPVIDGVAVATKLVEALVSLGLRTSTRGEYAPPRPKEYAGLLREFTVE
ncbi:aspartate/glutamate racemase family protein [Nonomuraea sp. NEAU-A123]|uniref:aspartate/glutamate racemase family protein n=1 Tax=Nonomuraea sp. NEAU-A123 TaxID=2839649 RepID=UPI001BE423E0|nr:aspartate/glutamate racemase family protein [Nonomuraea sp. NEAU-A123]MBT2230074.1 aspartate/glutamate racemase family protein [Nonomuraea sp. NEAU-A123]MBT2230656.1 aspartate/glutamate racemase family protein [Nonomuraea sp. NEAU-A123]